MSVCLRIIEKNRAEKKTNESPMQGEDEMRTKIIILRIAAAILIYVTCAVLPVEA